MPNQPEPGSQPDEAAPLLRVVKGEPSPDELAALVAVVAARRAAANAAVSSTTSRRSQWADHQHKHRRPHRPGPGAWKASARPH